MSNGKETVAWLQEDAGGLGMEVWAHECLIRAMLTDTL
jgi:hypothetical protein